MNTKSRLLILSLLFSLTTITNLIAQEEKVSEEEKDFQKLNFYDYRGTNVLDVGIGGSTLFGDYEDTSFGFYYRAGYKRSLTPHLFVGLSANGYDLSYEDIEQSLLSVDFNLEYLFMPTETFTPLVYGGLGMNMDSETDVNAMKAQIGFGFEVILDNNFGFKLFYEYNYGVDDDNEVLIADGANDKFMRLGIGLNYYFGGAQQRDKVQKGIKTIRNSNPIIPDN